MFRLKNGYVLLVHRVVTITKIKRLFSYFLGVNNRGLLLSEKLDPSKNTLLYSFNFVPNPLTNLSWKPNPCGKHFQASILYCLKTNAFRSGDELLAVCMRKI